MNRASWAEDFLLDAPERLYCFKPEKTWVLDKPEILQDHRIDQKTSEPITEVQKALRDIAECAHEPMLQANGFHSFLRPRGY